MSDLNVGASEVDNGYEPCFQLHRLPGDLHYDYVRPRLMRAGNTSDPAVLRDNNR